MVGAHLVGISAPKTVDCLGLFCLGKRIPPWGLWKISYARHLRFWLFFGQAWNKKSPFRGVISGVKLKHSFVFFIEKNSKLGGICSKYFSILVPVHFFREIPRWPSEPRNLIAENPNKRFVFSPQVYIYLQ